MEITVIKLRKVRNGNVKCDGRWYKPHVRLGIPAPRHLEGMTLAFGTYPPDFKSLSLWGTEGMFRAKTEAEFNRAYDLALKMITMRARAATWDKHYSDAVYVWEWWTESKMRGALKGLLKSLAVGTPLAKRG